MIWSIFYVPFNLSYIFFGNVYSYVKIDSYSILIDYLLFCLNCMSSLYILNTNSLSGICFASPVSYSIGRLFTLLFVPDAFSFDVGPSVYFLYPCALEPYSNSHCQELCQGVFLLSFLKEFHGFRFYICIFNSFELIFVSDVR